MLRRTAHPAVGLIAAVMLGGCSLFAPRPTPLDRPRHVIIVAIDGLERASIDSAKTPHLYLMQHDGAYTWSLRTDGPGDRTTTYGEALTGLPRALHTSRAFRRRSILARCRASGLGAISIIRSRELAALDPKATNLPAISKRLDHPVAAGAYAAAELLAKRPACMFIELSAGSDKIEDCDAGLGKLFAAIQRGGIADRTTIIVMSAKGRGGSWMIRGPDIRHGHKVVAPVTAASTAGAAIRLLLPAPTTADDALFPSAAFRAHSREPNSSGERTVARGSVRGRVLKPDGRPMARATVLLVKNEPVDGIHERWADTNSEGEFWFESIPATTYDHVFVFDNLPTRLRRSLLVKQGFTVKRDAPNNPLFHYRRMRGSDKHPPPAPPAESAAAFLDDDQIDSLAHACRAGLPVWSASQKQLGPPLLAADALSGRRVRTSLIRDWLLDAAKALKGPLKARSTEAATLDKMADLAAAYDLNRASGLLTDTEERDVRAVLADAARLLRRAHDQRTLPQDSKAYTPLALIAGALRPSELSSECLRDADAMFEKQFRAVCRQAELDPAAVEREDLCSILEYAMINRAIGCGNYVNPALRRLVELAARCLTPAERRVGRTAPAPPPAPGLGFLGLAKSAFAARSLGSRMQTLWQMAGAPYWAPRGDESLVGTLFTAAASPSPRAMGPAPSRQLTKTTAVLRKAWGTPDEWLVYVNGWNLDLHVGAARLARISTRPLNGLAKSRPNVLRFKSSPGYDYVLLGGWVSRGAEKKLAAYRHVLFNKLTGYVAVSDEFPAGFLTSTRVEASGARPNGVIRGAGGLEAQVLALPDRKECHARTLYLKGASSRPAFVIYLPPRGVKAGGAKLEPWYVDRMSFADADYRGKHIKLTTGRGPEFIRLARKSAHVADNIDDYLMTATVGLLRSGQSSVDLVLIDGKWAQCDDRILRLGRGSGYVTIHDTGRAKGWSAGRSRYVTLALGEGAPRSATLKVNGRRRSLRTKGGRVVFYLSSGAWRFTIE